MTTIGAIISYVESLSGHPLDRDEGVQHGSADLAASGVTVCWMATPDAIRSAGKNGHALLIGHESVYYPHDVINRPNPPAC